MRAPGAGGAWTAITPNTDLAFEEDLNQLQWLQVNLPLLSVAEETLVVEGNDIRALAAGTERWYGQIRRVNEDPYFLTWEVRALGKEVLARDRSWTSRREWVNLPPEVIVDEVLGNVMDEELRAGLVYWSDLEALNADGTLTDLSGNDNDGTFTGTSSVVGKWGLARRFVRADSEQVLIADSAELKGMSELTVAGWLFLDTIEVEQAMVDKFSHPDSRPHYMLGHLGTPGRVSWFVGDGSTFNSIIAPAIDALSTGQWYHLCGVYEAGARQELYIDGVLSVEDTTPPSFNIGSNAQDLYLGRVYGSYLNGRIDQVQVYDRALSAAQVLALAGRSIYEGGLLADSFDQISFRAEEDTRLNIVDGIAKAIGADWFSDRDGDDRDRFRLVARRGSPMATDTFALGTSVVGIEREMLRDTVRNDITALGYGDGQNQLRSRIWHATTIRSILSTDYTAASTGPISIPDTTDYPANGVVKLGGERVEYTGKTATQLGTTSVTRAYTADGYESLDAYLHKKGVAVWLHVDTVATPDTTYDPSSPQTGSSIQVNGHKQGEPAVDRGIIDQNTLDRLAQRLLDSYKDPRDSVFLKVGEEDIAARIGDAVDLVDSAAAPLFSSPYRLFDLRFRRADSLWDLELGSPRDVREAELARLREEMRLSRSYGQGATNEMTVPAVDNIRGATTPPGIPLVVIFETPVDAVAVNEVRVLTLAMQDFRSYVGGPDIARTSSEVVAVAHSHTYDRPSHQHGAAPTLDIPDATTTGDGTPSHTHPVTYVLHAVAQHAGEDPAGQQTVGQTGSGVGHNHGGNVGPHSHGAPAAGDTGATIAAASAPDRAHPDQDILTTGWTRTNAGIPFWDNIDDDPLSPGDTNFCFDENAAEQFLKIGLGDLADPVSAVNHIIRMRAVRFDLISGTVSLKAELRQGGTLIATLGPQALTLTETTYTYTLSAGEANSITDYTDLQLWFDVTARTGDSFARIESAEFEVPGHTHTITAQSHTHGPSDSTDLGDPTTGNSSVSPSHDHSLDPDGANHLHGEPSDGAATGTTGTTLGHSHTWSIAAHDHGNLANFNEPSLTVSTENDSAHDHSMQSHVHVAGIFETPYLTPSVGLRIDGTDRTTTLGGPWTTDQVDIVITEFVSAIGTHTLEFFEQADGKLGRLFVSVLVKFFIQSGTGS